MQAIPQFRSNIVQLEQVVGLQALVEDMSTSAKLWMYVYRLQYNGIKYILKVVKCSSCSTALLKRYMDEYAIIRSLYPLSPHIEVPVARAREEFPKENLVQVELLLLDGGVSIYQLMGKLSTLELLSVARQTVHAMSVCHHASYLHSDFKPSNLVMQNGHVQVIDFGVSKEFSCREALLKQTQTVSRKLIGYTIRYLPPECMIQQRTCIVAAVDVFSWGISMYQILSGLSDEQLAKLRAAYFFDQNQYQHFLARIASYSKPADPHPKLTSWLLALIGRALDFNPVLRPTFEDYRSLLGESPTPVLGLLGQVNVAEEVHAKALDTQQQLERKVAALRAETAELKKNMEKDKNSMAMVMAELKKARQDEQRYSDERKYKGAKIAQLTKEQNTGQAELAELKRQLEEKATSNKWRKDIMERQANQISELRKENTSNIQRIDSLCIVVRGNQWAAIDEVSKITSTQEQDILKAQQMRETKASNISQLRQDIAARKADIIKLEARLKESAALFAEKQPLLQLNIPLLRYFKTKSGNCQICTKKTKIRNLCCHCPICPQCLTDKLLKSKKTFPQCQCGLFLSPDLFQAIDPKATNELYGPCCFKLENPTLCTGKAELISNGCGTHVYCKACLRWAMQQAKISQEHFDLSNIQCISGCERPIDIPVFCSIDPELAQVLLPPCAMPNENKCPNKTSIVCACGCAFCKPCLRTFFTNASQIVGLENDINNLSCPNCSQSLLTRNIRAMLGKEYINMLAA